ncbi:hypothetical protein IFR04_009603 [Cadophora malorum]|uniref:Uncharacterized protein n=1 Tax=Cadophora malorum TaxID=108018 RepID=A0A8H7TEA3_9HELO|nr:hypothetical protein IFR04_009603 [Cadophora malorum]
MSGKSSSSTTDLPARHTLRIPSLAAVPTARAITMTPVLNPVALRTTTSTLTGPTTTPMAMRPEFILTIPKNTQIS